ncbi:DNA helicase UvrB [Enterococcus sp. 22-H-5-01]|uniref:DNA helicase UvrB n=1 Tax=Enterococcus sp. 22-H-5-01 TaxID=3418555 RepID=UPI003CFC26EC
MPTFWIDFGTKDAILAIAIIIILGMTIFFHWSAGEFIIAECAVVIAFYGGTLKQDKRITDKEKK